MASVTSRPRVSRLAVGVTVDGPEVGGKIEAWRRLDLAMRDGVRPKELRAELGG